MRQRVACIRSSPTHSPSCWSFSLMTAQLVSDSSSVGHRAVCIICTESREEDANSWSIHNRLKNSHHSINCHSLNLNNRSRSRQRHFLSPFPVNLTALLLWMSTENDPLVQQLSNYKKPSLRTVMDNNSQCLQSTLLCSCRWWQTVQVSTPEASLPLPQNHQVAMEISPHW